VFHVPLPNVALVLLGVLSIDGFGYALPVIAIVLCLEVLYKD
jgi:hypothetical protein